MTTQPEFKVKLNAVISCYLDVFVHLHYTLKNEGSLAVLKEPLWLFSETRGSFDGVGFF